MATGIYGPQIGEKIAFQAEITLSYVLRVCRSQEHSTFKTIKVNGAESKGEFEGWKTGKCWQSTVRI